MGRTKNKNRFNAAMKRIKKNLIKYCLPEFSGEQFSVIEITKGIVPLHGGIIEDDFSYDPALRKWTFGNLWRLTCRGYFKIEIKLLFKKSEFKRFIVPLGRLLVDVAYPDERDFVVVMKSTSNVFRIVPIHKIKKLRYILPHLNRDVVSFSIGSALPDFYIEDLIDCCIWEDGRRVWSLSHTWADEIYACETNNGVILERI